MGVVSVSSSASRFPLGSNPRPSRNSNCRSPIRRPVVLAFKIEKRKNKAFSTQQDPIALGIDTVKDPNSAVKRVHADSKRVKAVCVDEASSSAELDYNEVAATLENLYKLSPGDISHLEKSDQAAQKRGGRRKITKEHVNKKVKVPDVFKNDKRKLKRLSLHERISLRKKTGEASAVANHNTEEGKKTRDTEGRLLRDYSVSTDLVSLDWKKMKIPAVLSSSEHTSLFKLLQPVKVSLLL